VYWRTWRRRWQSLRTDAGNAPVCSPGSLDFAVRLRLMRATCADRKTDPRLYPFSSPPYRPYRRAAPVGLEKDGPQFSRDFAIICRGRTRTRG